jgi:tetratricopeptide (TPR) repeat protein
MSPAPIIPTELSKQNPWPGLRAFGEDDRDYFFGRDREAAELFSLVQRSSVVVLYGQSGLGKTSLLQAGLFPRLKTLNFFPVRVRFDHGDDAPPLAQQITSAVAEELDHLRIKGPRSAPNETLWEYFHRRDVDFWGPRNRLLTPVVVLDQFEEIFTLGHRSEKSNARVAEFQKELESLLEHRPPDAVRERLEANPDDALRYDLKKQSVKFVITLREDFLADLDPWRERMPSLLPNRFRLERMTGQQALEVVQRAGSDVVDPSVARDIVDFVSTSRLKRSSSALEQRDVDPALLSVVCDGLNYSRISRGQSRITADLLTAEREEIMKDFYERTFEGVDPRVRDWVEDRLLTSSGYRDRAALDDAKKLGLPEADFDVLVNRRLLHREERAGVIWLELTHDSLTDPASRSRAVREQRIQADAAKEREHAAAEREAQVRSQLRRSQVMVTGFGLLFVIALFAFYVSFRYYRQAKTNELLAKATAQRLETEHQAMLAAEAGEHRKDTELQSVREENEKNFKEQVAAAGSLFDMRVPTATVINIIQITDNSFITLSSGHTSQNDIDLPHARFLEQAAAALYQVGHYDEGLTYANRAMELVSGRTGPGNAEDHLAETRAGALYVRGVGLLAKGDLNPATQCFQEALKLASASADPDAKQDMARVFALSHIGLGEIAIDEYKYDDARNHYGIAAQFIQRSGSTSDEALYWEVLSLRGLWLSLADDLKAQPYISKANDLVGQLLTHDPGNIRWKTLSTEISYSQGFTALRLEQYDEAKGLFEQAEATAEDLCRRDAENREWRLGLTRIQRALGLVHYDQGELVAAEKFLKQAQASSKELNEQQKLWTRAAVVRGLALLSLGDLEASMHSQSPDASNDLNTVFNIYTQARTLFQENRASAPSVLIFDDDVALAAARQGYLRVLQADEARRKGADKQNQDVAMQRDNEALDFYSQAFKALEPLDVIAKDDPTIIQEKSDMHQRIGYLERSMREPAKAIAAFQQDVSGTALLVKMAPTAVNYGRHDVALSALGDEYEATHEYEKASVEYALASDALTKALALRPDDTELIRKQAVVQSRISDLWYDRGDLEKALNELERAFDSVWKALQYDYSGNTLNSNLKFYQDRLTRIRKAVTDKPATASPQLTLTPAASQALLHRIDDLAARTDASKLLDRNQKQAVWGLPTIMPGVWRILTAAERAAPIQHLLAIDKNVTAEQVQGIRRIPLDFYDDAALYEAEVKLPNDKDGIVTFVQRGTEWTLLEATATVEQLNKTAAPKLDTPDRALSYLCFWVGTLVEADHGRWRLIDRPEDIDWLDSAPGSLRESVAGKIKPLLLEPSSDKEWQAIGTIQYGNTLWEASFHVARNGDATYQQSRQIEKELPVSLDVFDRGIRVKQRMEALNQEKPQRDLAKALSALKANPKDEKNMRLVPAMYYGTKRWKDAVDAQKNWVAYLKDEPDAVPTKATSLRDALALLAWYQLFSRDFSGALATTDEITKLNPADMSAVEEHALALLFLGRTQEAEAVFLANGGKKMNSTANLIWEDSVFGDYAALRKEGVTSPDAERIGSLMTAQQDKRNMAEDESQLNQNPNDEKSLKQLPYLYYKAKRWADAVEAEKHLLTFMEAKPDSDSSKSASVRDTLDVLSWYQLFTRDFAGALASSDAARKLDPDHLFTESQRAHSLMFLGRNREAEEIYVGNIGRKMDGSGDSLWEAAVLADFTSLENEGLTNRELTRIRGLLRRPEYERLLGQYLQTLKTNPNDETALRYLPGVYYNLQRNRDAAGATKNRIAHLLRENKHDADATSTLEGAYTSLSWYQLLSGDFAGALTSTDEALKLDSTEPAATMNRAHALLFLSREKEAEAVYTANIGKKMANNQAWDEGVLDDLSSLENEGFTNPEVAHIRALMHRAASERLLARYTQELKSNPNDENALSRIGNVYLQLERWKEAVDAQKTYIAWLQRQPKHDAAWSNSLSGADVGLAWYQLFNRDFAGSLASSDEAMKLDPKDLAAQTNRAHALLFLGRSKEAEAVYLGHRGEKVFANSDEKWEDAILTDFDDLSKAGITNPAFPRLRALLKAPVK